MKSLKTKNLEQIIQILTLTDVITDESQKTVRQCLLGSNLVLEWKNKKIIGVSGVCNCFGDDPKGVKWLTYTAILPEFQGQGIGSSLLSRIEERLKAKKLKLLCVDTHSKKAMRFYKKNGFKKSGEIPNYYNSGESKITLYKFL